MNWTAIGSLAELVGAIAVVASLLYVGRQVRHTVKAAEVEGIESLQRLMAEMALAVVADPELAELLMRVQYEGARREEMTKAERGRIGYLYFAVLATTNAFWERERAGLMSHEFMEGHVQRNTPLLVAPYFREVWPFMSPGFSPEFQTFVDTTWLAHSPEPRGSASTA